MKDVSKFLGKKKGDVIALSTSQTMDDHNEFELEMIIEEVRTYSEPHGIFEYVGYIAKPMDNDDMTYMLLIRKVDEDYDLMLYHLRMDGGMDQAREGIINEAGDDLIEEFCIDIFDNEGEPHPVTWTKKASGTFFGIEFDDGTDEGIKTICEYQTDDECGDNPHALIEWTGDDEDGWAELWVGSPIEEFEVKLLSRN